MVSGGQETGPRSRSSQKTKTHDQSGGASTNGRGTAQALGGREKIDRLVFNRYQKQTARRRGGASRDQAAKPQPCLDSGAIHVSFACLQQNSHNVSHHVFQKATSGHTVNQPFPLLFQF